jgi:hypothetical protein
MSLAERLSFYKKHVSVLRALLDCQAKAQEAQQALAVDKIVLIPA